MHAAVEAYPFAILSSKLFLCDRQERAQQILQAKYERIVTNFGAGMAEIQSALHQVERCFDLLRGDSALGDSAPAQPSAPAPSAADAAMDDEEWEDIDDTKGEPSVWMMLALLLNSHRSQL